MNLTIQNESNQLMQVLPGGSTAIDVLLEAPLIIDVVPGGSADN
jgi:hypothetical protein